MKILSVSEMNVFQRDKYDFVTRLLKPALQGAMRVREFAYNVYANGTEEIVLNGTHISTNYSSKLQIMDDVVRGVI